MNSKQGNFALVLKEMEKLNAQQIINYAVRNYQRDSLLICAEDGRKKGLVN